MVENLELEDTGTGDKETLNKVQNMRLASYVEQLRLPVQVDGDHQVRHTLCHSGYVCSIPDIDLAVEVTFVPSSINPELPGWRSSLYLMNLFIQGESSMGCLVDPCEE